MAIYGKLLTDRLGETLLSIDEFISTNPLGMSTEDLHTFRYTVFAQLDEDQKRAGVTIKDKNDGNSKTYRVYEL